MKRITFAAAVVMGLAPGIALAEGCGFGHQTQAMSCPQGQTYDPATQACVPGVSS